MNEKFISILDKIEEALNRALPASENAEGVANWKQEAFGNVEDVPFLHIQNLISPNRGLIDLGGKRWRPLLMILCYQMAKAATENEKNHGTGDSGIVLSEEQVYNLTPLVEFVHTASLIHDDIEDSADLRRGKPAAHITYGLDTALNAGSWLYFTAPVSIDNADISDEMKLLLYKTYTRELRRLHLGQAMDIYWHRNPSIFPSQEEYFNMVKCKTGTLASLSAQVGCIAGGMSEAAAGELGEVAANIGIGFQIIDDVINLTTGNVGKKRGDDIVEGKKSLPVILHSVVAPQDKAEIGRCMGRAGEEGIDSPAVEECISILESKGAIKAAAEKGTALIRENCGKLRSELIQELFVSMIPENFR